VRERETRGGVVELSSFNRVLVFRWKEKRVTMFFLFYRNKKRFEKGDNQRKGKER